MSDDEAPKKEPATEHERALEAFAQLGKFAAVAGSRAHFIASGELANIATMVMYCDPEERDALAERLVALSVAVARSGPA